MKKSKPHRVVRRKPLRRDKSSHARAVAARNGDGGVGFETPDAAWQTTNLMKASIAAMQERMPPDIRAEWDELQKRADDDPSCHARFDEIQTRYSLSTVELQALKEEVEARFHSEREAALPLTEKGFADALERSVKVVEQEMRKREPDRWWEYDSLEKIDDEDAQEERKQAILGQFMERHEDDVMYLLALEHLHPVTLENRYRQLMLASG